MTSPNELWEELEKLASPEEAKKVAQQRNRSNFRPPFISATVDIDDTTQPFDETLNNGQSRKVIGLWLTNIRDAQWADGQQPVDEYEWRIGVPAKANENSEFYLVLNQFGSKGAKLPYKGLKGVKLEEDVHEYTARGFITDPNGEQVDNRGSKGYWSDNKVNETRYYKVLSIAGGARANGSTPAPEAVITPELRKAALEVLVNEYASDLEGFKKNVLKADSVQAVSSANERQVLGVTIQTGRFISSAVSDGLLTTNEEGAYVLREVGVA